MFKIHKDKINDVILISSLKHFDQRGFFSETFKYKEFPKSITQNSFLLEGHAFSKKKYTLRGIHFQIKNPQCQILQIISGSIKLVLIDLRFQSKTFKEISYINMNTLSNNMVYMPPGVGSGYLTKTDNVNILYKMNKYFNKKYDAGIKWNSNFLNIKWFAKNPIISIKDKSNNDFDFYDFKKLDLK